MVTRVLALVLSVTMVTSQIQFSSVTDALKHLKCFSEGGVEEMLLIVHFLMDLALGTHLFLGNFPPFFKFPPNVAFFFPFQVPNLLSLREIFI